MTSKTADRVRLYVLVGIVVAGCISTVSLHVGIALMGSVGEPSWNPVRLILQLIDGSVVVSRGTMLLAVIVGTVLTGSIVVPLVVRWRRRPRERGDRAARLTGGRRDSQPIRRRQVEQKAAVFGLDPAQHPGYPLGRSVADGEDLFGDWESVGITIAGPRTGKTTAVAIPLILAAPGAVLATSNKRDLVDATRLVRERETQESVWVFDPCEITKRRPEFFWNPLTFLTSPWFNSSIVARALALSKVLGDAARATGGRYDRYDGFWDGGGDRIRSQLLAAAALDKRTMHDVYYWVSKETDVEPVDILRRQGYTSMADSLQGAFDLPPDTKGGMWACARMGLGWVEDPNIDAWWTPGLNRREFDPTDFVQSRQTLYSLSVDSASATPLVAALTAVTCLAAEYRAESHGGRLPTPMMVVLDEAANVCPWRELPQLYSHFGSKGICLQTLLQSWSQGVDVWGETGVAKLWSAANTALYAGGVKEVDQLERISKLIGTERADQVSRSISHGARTTSITEDGQERPIAPVEALASLPAWRGWLIASGARPVLVELVPWFRTAKRAQVEESLAVVGSGSSTIERS